MTSAKTIKLGTRGSKLALAQTHLITKELNKIGFECRPIIIKGDDATSKHRFTKNLERALLTEKVDLAVHSLKDLPAKLDEPFELVLFSKRANPYDCFITKGKNITTIGTDSLRRRAQLGFINKHLVASPLRGNIETRLAKLTNGSRYDGIVIAACALERLGINVGIEPNDNHISSRILDQPQFIPSAGQGIIAVEGLKSGRWNFDAIDDVSSRQMATAERAFLHKLGASCNTPIGALATIQENNNITLSGFVGDGNLSFFGNAQAKEPVALGEKLALQLRKQGGEEFWHKIL